VAEELAWLGLGLVPDVPPIACSQSCRARRWQRTFGRKLESRAWSRSASSMVSGFSSLCRSVDCARSASPPPRVGGSAPRVASSSPVGLRLSRMPRLKPWRGPLPHRRIMPVPIFGDFLAVAKLPNPALERTSPTVGAWAVALSAGKTGAAPSFMP
jgi:hypothetical protein